jgi:transposase InsO family protein
LDLCIEGIDLSKLLKGKPLTIASRLAANGYAISVISLADSGANGPVFIDRSIAVQAAKFLGLNTIRLTTSCGTKGFNGEPGAPITHAIVIPQLWIDGRRFMNVPMLIAELGQHQLILGRSWMEEHDLWIDVRNRRLVWPEERSQQEELTEKMNVPVPMQILQRPKATVDQQKDAARRDALMEDEIEVKKCRKNVIPFHEPAGWGNHGPIRTPQLQPPKQRKHVRFDSSYQPKSTESIDRRESMEKMQRALTDLGNEPEPEMLKSESLLERLKKKPLSCQLDICLIGATGFRRHMGKKDIDICYVTLNEIERLLDEKLRDEAPEDRKEIEEKLPKEYHEFADVFSKRESDLYPPSRENVDFKIHLEEGSDPVRQIGHGPIYKMNAEELAAAYKYMMENLEKGFIAPSAAPFASPILMARNPSSGKLRFCVDFRRLNAITKKDRYPIPLVDELMDRLAGAKFFTKLDIRQGFHRIRISPESQDLTTFRTRYGMYKYKVVPFGLSNGPAVFQRYVNTQFFDYLDKFLTAFMDDLLIYSKTIKEHKEHVRKVLQRLREAGLQASISKCEFHVTRTKYLGFIITTEGVEADPEKVAIVLDWKVPTTVKGVQSFLGFCNFYRRFIRSYSQVSRALHRLTKKDRQFVWTPECQAAMNALKQALTNAPVLRYYDPNLRTRVETDASDEVVAGVMSQQDPELMDWHPIAFYSTSMNSAEQNYDIHDKEMLAIIRALREWRPELEGLQRAGPFEVITDHRALLYFMKSKTLNARQARWAEFLSRFDFEIQYRPGRENTLADALSRPEASVKADRTQVLLKSDKLAPEIRAEIQQEVEISPLESNAHVVDRVRGLNRTSATLEKYREKADEGDGPYTLEDHLLLYKGRLVVATEADETLPAQLIKEAHAQISTAHPGQRKTQALIRARYWWPTWRNDVIRYVRNCSECRRTTPAKDKTPGLLKPLPISDRPWKAISMDYHYLPKDKHGYDCVYVVVDRFGKRVISIPCYRTVTARDMARMFVERIYRYYGPPDTIVSDRGPQFISDFWHEFTRILGIRLKLSTAEHPQTDGQTEVANQHLDQRLRPFVNYNKDNWSELLPMMDFAAAMLVQESTGVSPFMADCGYEPRTSFDWKPLEKGLPRAERMNREDARNRVESMKEVWDWVQQNLQRAQINMKKQADRHRREPDFEKGSFVYLNMKRFRKGDKLANTSEGPFEVLEKEGNAFRLKLPPGMNAMNTVFSPDKLRKAGDDPLPGQLITPPGPVEINGGAEWEVERILASRLFRKKTLQYRAEWVGHDPDPEWYPASDFRGSPHAIRDFHIENPKAAGPPRRLDRWLRAWEQDEDLEEVPEDDLPA